MVGHGEHGGEDGGGVDGANAASAVLRPVIGTGGGLHVLDDGVGDDFVPAFPRLAANHVLRRGGVEIAVHIPLV